VPCAGFDLWDIFPNPQVNRPGGRRERLNLDLIGFSGSIPSHWQNKPDLDGGLIKSRYQRADNRFRSIRIYFKRFKRYSPSNRSTTQFSGLSSKLVNSSCNRSLVRFMRSALFLGSYVQLFLCMSHKWILKRVSSLKDPHRLT